MERILSSVGRNGSNHTADVRKIQQLLNRFRHHGDSLLKVDGIAGHHTIAAIEHFQKARMSLARADGRVDPHGPTILRLSEHPGLRGTVHPQHLAVRHTRVERQPAPSRSEQSSAPTPVEANAQPGSAPHSPAGAIAWGAKVSPAFKAKVVAISGRLQVSPDFLMSCMAFESGETFSPLIRNAAGSGAIGLIQFMPSTAKTLQTSTKALGTMTPEQQLDYVEAYFEDYAGRLHTIEDIYMAILYPKAIGRGSDYVLFKSGTVAFRQNKGLDSDQDGKVTAHEAAAAVRRKYIKGLGQGYLG